MSRALLKTGAALAFDVAGGTRLLRWQARRRHDATVLYHHRVMPDPRALAGSIPSMAISCDSFEWLLDELARHYRFIGLDELDVDRAGDKPALAVTFDDGYRDFYEHAFPILARKGIPATVFVITDLVGTPVAPFHDRFYLSLSSWWRRHSQADLPGLLARAGIGPEDGSGARLGRRLHGIFRSLLTGLGRPQLERLLAVLSAEIDAPPADDDRFRLMSWEMLAEVQAEGITVGSHTRSHVLLPNESPQRVRDEVRGSLAELHRRLGPGPRYLSYPDGRFDAGSVRAVATAGYRGAFTTCRCRVDGLPSMTIARRHLWEAEVRDVAGRRSPSMLACRTAGLFDVATPCRAPHGLPRRPLRVPGQGAELH